MELSLRWAARSRAAHGDNPAMPCSASCRAACTTICAASPWRAAGYRLRRLRHRRPVRRRAAGKDAGGARLPRRALPRAHPRYLMGVGTPADIVEGVRRGIDMFDCVMPTRNARNGHLFTSTGRGEDPQCRAHARHRRPWTRDCDCYTCRTSAAPTCTTWTSATRSSAPSSTPCTTCTTTSATCADIRAAIEADTSWSSSPPSSTHARRQTVKKLCVYIPEHISSLSRRAVRRRCRAYR
jgi:hypothetical protein